MLRDSCGHVRGRLEFKQFLAAQTLTGARCCVLLLTLKVKIIFKRNGRIVSIFCTDCFDFFGIRGQIAHWASRKCIWFTILY